MYRRYNRSPAGFQPTYKELKPGAPGLTPVVVKRFQPTYKELKPEVGGYFMVAYARFQPTYKELKRVSAAVGGDLNIKFLAYL